MTKRVNAWSRKPTPSAIRRTPAARTSAEAGSGSQPVSDHGIRPATMPGATSRKAALPRAALALRTGPGRLSREGADQLGEALGLVLGNEGVGVLDPLEPRAGDRLRQALSVGGLEEAILDRPGEQRGLVELAQLVRGLEGVLGVDTLEQLDGVSADPTVGEEGRHPFAGRGRRE